MPQLWSLHTPEHEIDHQVSWATLYLFNGLGILLLTQLLLVSQSESYPALQCACDTRGSYVTCDSVTCEKRSGSDGDCVCGGSNNQCVRHVHACGFCGAGKPEDAD